jgi:chromosome segregation ATPase
LKAKDQKNAKEIEAQMKRLVKLQENIAHLKAKLSNNSKDYEERNRGLREEKEAIQTHFQAMKRRMNTFREEERRRLTELTVCTSNVLKKLDAKVVQAERIIKLAEMNSKLETEEEKILPFYEQANVTVHVDDGGHDRDRLEDSPDIEMPREFDPMDQFSKRYNKVLLDRMALEQKRAVLREENEHLRSILKQYLDGLTVNEQVLADLNPLFVINGQTNAPLNHKTGPVNITYIEASKVHF